MYLRQSEGYDVWATMREMDRNVYRENAKAAILAMRTVMDDVPKQSLADKVFWRNAISRIEKFIVLGI